MRGIERSEMALNVRHAAESLVAPRAELSGISRKRAEFHGAISLRSIALIPPRFARPPSPTRGPQEGGRERAVRGLARRVRILSAERRRRPVRRRAFRERNRCRKSRRA